MRIIVIDKFPFIEVFVTGSIYPAQDLDINKLEHNIFCLLAANDPAEVVYRAKVRKVGILPYDLPHL